ncbi:NAD(P)-dependent dehydrogenase (short-subunit alcohol dehydrogenase family) [Plasticicumulans lactativorans]|uniref:NAD(P)-dependent dehydrogenase (Short-subunit alcohol dehydrogenase family) n=1 Tax=Plasticicumulans lactativorans TaxID=1133106 RepID=A0A4R2L9P4_9GAMM|nr:YciK family oxidoreductase [Plasticicumulans lactativorans]TCO83501.1 NAD(P)-dependent dehydrogenase (short-subunit alcohol dehydrogenase family) [Plasticicumulans lactativorans]
MQDYQPAPDLLQNRVILITGAGDGIGRATARACAAHGATVILLGRTLKKLEAVYDEIVAAGGPEPVLHPMNLLGTNGKEYFDLADAIEENFGRLDGLLHNAGWVGALTPIANYDVELWFQAIQVNLHAPFLLTHTLLGLLNAAPDASVVFSADAVADAGKAYWGAYGVAKGGTQTLMKILANELEANTAIRVNSVDPGVVRTNLRVRVYPGISPEDWASPEAVVLPYLYLLGPDSRGVTGQTLRAQG